MFTRVVRCARQGQSGDFDKLETVDDVPQQRKT